ncbi:unnamed protein product [Caenorhabditis nigoni]
MKEAHNRLWRFNLTEILDREVVRSEATLFRKLYSVINSADSNMISEGTIPFQPIPVQWLRQLLLKSEIINESFAYGKELRQDRV